MEKKHFIYMTTNLINGKRYIGKHFGYENDSYLGSGTLIQKAIKKYGKDNFERKILCFSKDNQENNLNEQLYIKKFNAVKDEQFYNISEGGDGGDIFHTLPQEKQEEIRIKASLNSTGDKNGMYGKKHTKETIEKLKKIDKSYTKTPEFRKKMSEVTSGSKNGMYGRKHTEESKRKMSESSKGKNMGAKNGMYGKTGDKALNGKYIGMYNENDELIRIFHSKKGALEFLGMKGHTQLDNAIKNHTIYKGYYWKNEIKSVETK